MDIFQAMRVFVRVVETGIAGTDQHAGTFRGVRRKAPALGGTGDTPDSSAHPSLRLRSPARSGFSLPHFARPRWPDAAYSVP